MDILVVSVVLLILGTILIVLMFRESKHKNDKEFVCKRCNLLIISKASEEYCPKCGHIMIKRFGL